MHVNHDPADNSPDNLEIHLDDDERTPCEIWTRVMGYHRPVQFFNPGKKAEHRDRAYFVERAQ